MKPRCAFTLALFLSTCTAQAAPTLKAEVNGMVCAFCAQGIEKKLRALPQTKDVYVNLKQRIVAVEVKDGQTLDAQTVRELVRQAGYEVVLLQTVAQSAAELQGVR